MKIVKHNTKKEALMPSCVPCAGLVREVFHLGGDCVVQFHAIGFSEHDALLNLVLPIQKIQTTNPIT